MEFINSTSFIDRINDGGVVRIDFLDKQIILEIQDIGKEKLVFDKIGEPYFSYTDSNNQTKIKTLYFNAYSEYEMKKPDVSIVLKEAIKYEKNGNHLFAHTFFKAYLNEVRFKSVIFSSNKIFDKVKIGDKIIGNIHLYENDNYKRFEYNPKSIRFSENT